MTETISAYLERLELLYFDATGTEDGRASNSLVKEAKSLRNDKRLRLEMAFQSAR